MTRRVLAVALACLLATACGPLEWSRKVVRVYTHEGTRACEYDGGCTLTRTSFLMIGKVMIPQTHVYPALCQGHQQAITEHQVTEVMYLDDERTTKYFDEEVRVLKELTPCR